MTPAGRSKKGMTAGELMAQLRADPAWVAADAERQQRRDEDDTALLAAQRQLVADLAAVGVDVTSVWDLVSTSRPYPAALPVLVEHLGRDHPDKVGEGIARALAVEPAVAWWDDLVRHLRAAPVGSGTAGGLGAALAAAATEDQAGALRGLLQEESLGEVRIYFVRPLLRVGGSEARVLLEGLAQDAVLGREVRIALGGRDDREVDGDRDDPDER